MAKLLDKYKVDLEINKDEILKDLREIKNEVKSVTKEIDSDIKHLRLKRKDILIVKIDMYLKEDDIQKIEQRLRKKLHRKVLVFDKTVTEVETIQG